MAASVAMVTRDPASDLAFTRRARRCARPGAVETAFSSRFSPFLRVLHRGGGLHSFCIR
jgi:hypothetical protein